MKKILCFDLDQTLSPAKYYIEDDMAKILIKLLDRYEIAPISGQRIEEFLEYIIGPLYKHGVTPRQLTHIHLFPTSGARYYKYDMEKGSCLEKDSWVQVYSYDLTADQIERMTDALKQAVTGAGHWVDLAGDKLIEDRESQVTYSGLGQKAALEAKLQWDPDKAKRQDIAKRAKAIAPEFTFLVAGSTSVDALMPGYDKGFGMRKLLEHLKVDMEDVLFFGDMTQKGGNDFPVAEMGFDFITVKNQDETECILKEMLTNPRLSVCRYREIFV